MKKGHINEKGYIYKAGICGLLILISIMFFSSILYSTEEVNADGAGGGSSTVTPGSGNYASVGGYTYFFYDQIGFTGNSGSVTGRVQPTQSATATSVPNSHVNFWLDIMDDWMTNHVANRTCKIKRTNSWYTDGSTWTARYEAVRDAIEEAYANAFARDPEAVTNGRKARIIGFAYEYIYPGEDGGGTAWNIWTFSNSSGASGSGYNDDFASLFNMRRNGNRGSFYVGPDYAYESNNSKKFGLRPGQGWKTEVDVSKFNDATAGDTWNMYQAKAAVLDKGTRITKSSRGKIHAIAVLDDWPEGLGTLVITKTSNRLELLTSYPVDGAEFTVYLDEACTQVVKDSSGNNVVVTISNGRTPDIKLTPGTYYIKETKFPAGYQTTTTVRQTTVSAGSVTEITIENALQPGKIKVNKTY